MFHVNNKFRFEKQGKWAAGKGTERGERERKYEYT